MLPWCFLHVSIQSAIMPLTIHNEQWTTTMQYVSFAKKVRILSLSCWGKCQHSLHCEAITHQVCNNGNVAGSFIRWHHCNKKVYRWFIYIQYIIINLYFRCQLLKCSWHIKNIIIIIIWVSWTNAIIHIKSDFTELMKDVLHLGLCS